MFQLWAGILPTSKCLDERVHPQECKSSRPLDTHVRTSEMRQLPAVGTNVPQITPLVVLSPCSPSSSSIDSICHIFIADSHL
jgi:hypothetical protein